MSDHVVLGPLYVAGWRLRREPWLPSPILYDKNSNGGALYERYALASGCNDNHSNVVLSAAKFFAINGLREAPPAG